MKGYNKILAAVLSLSVILMAVTYQPMHSEAFAGKVASYAAKKAAVWVAKETAEGSIEKMLKKKVDITDPLFKNYIGRIDYDLVHIDGKTFLLRNNLGAAEKKALGDQIGVVVDRMMYGQNAAWLSWVDWWSIGPMLLIGNVIYSEMTDENYSFINDVLIQAMIDLGFLQEPESNFTDSKTNEPVKHYDTPPPTPEPAKNLNYSQVLSFKGTPSNAHTAILPLSPSQTPMAIGTYVVELVPNAPVAKLDSNSTSNSWVITRLKDPYIFNFEVAGGNTFWNKFGNWEDKIDIYQDDVKTHSDVRSVDLSKSWSTVQLKKINRYIYSWDISKNRSVMILQSTVDNTMPIYKFVIKGKPNSENIYSPDLIRTAFYTSPELNQVGFKVYQDYFTDRIITPPSARPAPQLKDVKPSNPKDYVSGPVINNNPNTGKPTMAVPTTVIVQDPKTTPVKSDPKGGITITKPDGTPVTDPETELEPVTNQPEVKPNPNTGEPEIITQPNTPPEPATPPKTDPGTGEPGTGDPGNTTPPADPDDPDGQGKPSEVDWEKLKRIPYLFTTKFPFSLPWDAKRAAVAIFGDVPVVSKFEYTVEIPIGDGKPYKLDLSFPAIMDTFGNIFRTGLLIAFDIGLLYAVRKWFGGAS